MSNNLFAIENYRPNQKQLPPIMMIYGEVGIGKSTFCSGFPKPFFFDFEGRTSHIEGIVRDSDFNLGLNQLSSWKQLISAINQLGPTEYRTIVFDGVAKLQGFLWQEVNRLLAEELIKFKVSCAKDLTFGKGYGKAYEVFSSLMEAAKNLQRNYKKTIIFVDHEKLKEDEAASQAPNSTSFAKFVPECMNGVLKILLKESDYVFRLVEKFATQKANEKNDNEKNFTKKNVKKNAGSIVIFDGLELLTDRKVNPECFLKTSLPLPSRVRGSYLDFKAAYEAAYYKVHPKSSAVNIENNAKEEQREEEKEAS